MINSIYLHIGLHKTGTSSIQSFLDKNSNSMKKREGVVYFKPSPWPLPFKNGKPSVNLKLRGFDGLKDINAKKAVISHENYSWLFDESDVFNVYQKLKEYADDVYVVLYLRRQDSLAISQKQEGTKWLDNSVAYGHELKALPSELNYYSSNYLDFYKKVKLWSSIFGKNNVIVRIFEKDKLLGGDVVKDFSDIIGLRDYSEYEPAGRVNESIGKIEQLFLHKTRPWFNEGSVEKNYLVKSVLSEGIGSGGKLLPSRQEAFDFYERFLAGNKRLDKEFSKYQGELVFSTDFSMYEEKSNAEDFSEDEMLTIFSKVIKSIAEENESLHKVADRDSVAFWLRDMATRLESDRVDLSLILMEKALEFKPHGPFIKKKIEQYKGMLQG